MSLTQRVVPLLAVAAFVAVQSNNLRMELTAQRSAESVVGFERPSDGNDDEGTTLAPELVALEMAARLDARAAATAATVATVASATDTDTDVSVDGTVARRLQGGPRGGQGGQGGQGGGVDGGGVDGAGGVVSTPDMELCTGDIATFCSEFPVGTGE